MLQRSANLEARAQAEEVLAWANGLAESRGLNAQLAARGVLTHALMAMRGWADPEVKASVDASTRRLARRPRQDVEVQTRWALMTYHYVANHGGELERLTHEFSDLATRSEDGGLRIAGATFRGLVEYRAGRYAQADRQLSECTALYVPDLHRHQIQSFGLDSLVWACSTLVRWFRGDPDSAKRLAGEALAWARELGHLPSLGIALLYAANLYHYEGEKAEVDRLSAELLEIDAKYGFPAYCLPCGNGVAAGTSLEEAILQALLELVERDAVAIWWYNRLVLPEFPHVGHSYVQRALAQQRQGGTDVQLLDLTHDLGIPVCAAVRHDVAGGLGLGFGCHLDPQLAAERALTELNQLADGRHPVSGKPLLDTSRLCDRRFLSSGPRKHASNVASFDGPHLAADIEECARRLTCCGLEIWVVDKTRPDFGLNVAQVIVPGLRHFWPRFAPGRLFDVPVKLGLVPRPNGESELNDVPLLL